MDELNGIAAEILNYNRLPSRSEATYIQACQQQVDLAYASIKQDQTCLLSIVIDNQHAIGIANITITKSYPHAADENTQTFTIKHNSLEPNSDSRKSFDFKEVFAQIPEMDGLHANTNVSCSLNFNATTAVFNLHGNIDYASKNIAWYVQINGDVIYTTTEQTSHSSFKMLHISADKIILAQPLRISNNLILHNCHTAIIKQALDCNHIFIKPMADHDFRCEFAAPLNVAKLVTILAHNLSNHTLAIVFGQQCIDTEPQFSIIGGILLDIPGDSSLMVAKNACIILNKYTSFVNAHVRIEGEACVAQDLYIPESHYLSTTRNSVLNIRGSLYKFNNTIINPTSNHICGLVLIGKNLIAQRFGFFMAAGSILHVGQDYVNHGGLSVSGLVIGNNLTSSGINHIRYENVAPVMGQEIEQARMRSINDYVDLHAIYMQYYQSRFATEPSLNKFRQQSLIQIFPQQQELLAVSTEAIAVILPDGNLVLQPKYQELHLFDAEWCEILAKHGRAQLLDSKVLNPECIGAANGTTVSQQLERNAVQFVQQQPNFSTSYKILQQLRSKANPSYSDYAAAFAELQRQFHLYFDKLGQREQTRGQSELYNQWHQAKQKLEQQVQQQCYVSAAAIAPRENINNAPIVKMRAENLAYLTATTVPARDGNLAYVPTVQPRVASIEINHSAILQQFYNLEMFGQLIYLELMSKSTKAMRVYKLQTYTAHGVSKQVLFPYDIYPAQVISKKLDLKHGCVVVNNYCSHGTLIVNGCFNIEARMNIRATLIHIEQQVHNFKRYLIEHHSVKRVLGISFGGSKDFVREVNCSDGLNSGQLIFGYGEIEVALFRQIAGVFYAHAGDVKAYGEQLITEPIITNDFNMQQRVQGGVLGRRVITKPIKQEGILRSVLSSTNNVNFEFARIKLQSSVVSAGNKLVMLGNNIELNNSTTQHSLAVQDTDLFSSTVCLVNYEKNISTTLCAKQVELLATNKITGVAPQFMAVDVTITAAGIKFDSAILNYVSQEYATGFDGLCYTERSTLTQAQRVENPEFVANNVSLHATGSGEDGNIELQAPQVQGLSTQHKKCNLQLIADNGSVYITSVILEQTTHTVSRSIGLSIPIVNQVHALIKNAVSDKDERAKWRETANIFTQQIPLLGTFVELINSGDSVDFMHNIMHFAFDAHGLFKDTGNYAEQFAGQFGFSKVDGNYKFKPELKITIRETVSDEFISSVCGAVLQCANLVLESKLDLVLQSANISATAANLSATDIKFKTTTAESGQSSTTKAVTVGYKDESSVSVSLSYEENTAHQTQHVGGLLAVENSLEMQAENNIKLSNTAVSGSSVILHAENLTMESLQDTAHSSSSNFTAGTHLMGVGQQHTDLKDTANLASITATKHMAISITDKISLQAAGIVYDNQATAGSLSGIDNNKQVVNFSEVLVAADGECAFTAIGIERAAAIEKLIAHKNDANIRRMLAFDLLSILVSGADSADYELLPSSIINATNISALLNAYATTPNEQTKAPLLDLLSNVEIYSEFVTKVIANNHYWLSYQRDVVGDLNETVDTAVSTFDALAQLFQLNIQIWGKQAASNNGLIKLKQLNPTAVNCINILHVAQGRVLNHFNRLLAQSAVINAQEIIGTTNYDFKTTTGFGISASRSDPDKKDNHSITCSFTGSFKHKTQQKDVVGSISTNISLNTQQEPMRISRDTARFNVNQWSKATGIGLYAKFNFSTKQAAQIKKINLAELLQNVQQAVPEFARDNPNTPVVFKPKADEEVLYSETIKHNQYMLVNNKRTNAMTVVVLNKQVNTIEYFATNNSFAGINLKDTEFKQIFSDYAKYISAQQGIAEAKELLAMLPQIDKIGLDTLTTQMQTKQSELAFKIDAQLQQLNNNTLDLTKQTEVKQTINAESKELLMLIRKVALINVISKHSITYASIAKRYNLSKYKEVRELQQRLARAGSEEKQQLHSQLNQKLNFELNKINQQIEGYKADVTLQIKYAQSNSRMQAIDLSVKNAQHRSTAAQLELSNARIQALQLDLDLAYGLQLIEHNGNIDKAKLSLEQQQAKLNAEILHEQLSLDQIENALLAIDEQLNTTTVYTYDPELVDEKNDLIRAKSKAQAKLQDQQLAAQEIASQQQVLNYIQEHKISRDNLGSKQLNLGEFHRMQRHIEKLEQEQAKVDSELQRLTAMEKQYSNNKLVLDAVKYRKDVFITKKAELEAQKQQKVTRQKQVDLERHAGFTASKEYLQQKIQRQQTELAALEQKRLVLNTQTEQAVFNITALEDLDNQIVILEQCIANDKAKITREFVYYMHNSMIEEKRINANLTTINKLENSDKTEAEKQKIIARSNWVSNLKFNMERTYARTEIVINPLMTIAAATALYANPITTIGSVVMYSIVDPYVVAAIKGTLSTGLELLAVDSDIAANTAAPIAEVISFILPIPVIDKFAKKLPNLMLRDYNITGVKYKFDNFLSEPVQGFKQHVATYREHTNKTLFLSAKIKIDPEHINPQAIGFHNAKSIDQYTMRHVLGLAHDNKTIYYKTQIFDEQKIVHTVEHQVFNKNAITEANNYLSRNLQQSAAEIPNIINEQVYEHLFAQLRAEIQAKNSFGLIYSDEVAVQKGIEHAKVLQQERIVAFSRQGKMTGTDGIIIYDDSLLIIENALDIKTLPTVVDYITSDANKSDSGSGVILSVGKSSSKGGKGSKVGTEEDAFVILNGTIKLGEGVKSYEGIPIGDMHYVFIADPRLVVDMGYIGEDKAGTNANGFKRSKSYYWEKIRELHPNAFSKDNIDLMDNNKVPEVDDVFTAIFPQYKGYEKCKMVHHHIGGGPEAFAVPEPLHRGIGGIHLAEKAVGLAGLGKKIATEIKEQGLKL